jgi:hypothetical protein
MDNGGGNGKIKRQRSFVTQRLKKTISGGGTPGDWGRKSNGEIRCVRALIDCGATSIFMTPRLLKRLGISGGTHHHPRHDRRCDAICKGQPEDADHSPVRELSRTGRQIGGASCPNVRIRFSTWLTMVSQTKSRNRQRSMDSLQSPSASGAEK